MKRSTIIIIIIISVSIIGGGLLGFYFYINSSSTTRNQLGNQSINTGSSFGSPSVNTSITLPGNASTTQPSQTPEIVATTTQVEATKDTPVLRQIHEYPTAGFSFFTEDIIATSSAITETVVVANGTTSTSSTKTIKPAQTRVIGKKEVLHIIDRGNGHIFKTSSSTFVVEKISNYTVPKIYEGYFLSPTTFMFRGLYQDSDIIQTQFATLRLANPTSTEKIIEAKDLPANLAQLAVSPNKQKTFYVQNNSRPTGVITNPDGSGIVSAFSSTFTEWNITWPSEKIITLNTKPSAFAKGFLYTLNPTTLAIQKVLGNITGLTSIMSPNGNTVVYSESSAGSPNLYSLDRKTGETKTLFFRTFTDKCVWSVKEVDIIFCAVPQDIAYGDYPDAWYQGLISFTDDIWKINIKTGETRLLAKLNQLNDGPIDVIQPTLSTNEDYLVFNNKKDLSLWGLKLPGKPAVATSTTSTKNTATTSRPLSL
jgi:hypothetical protein